MIDLTLIITVALTGLFTLTGAIIGYFVSIYTHHQEREDKYLFALIEKKFDIYQQAYVHSRELRSIIHEQWKKKSDVITKTDDWLEANCLYLDPEIRDDFRDIIECVHDYSTELHIYAEFKREGNTEEALKSHQEIKTTFRKIVGLPERIEKSIETYYEPKHKGNIKDLFRVKNN